MIDVILQNTSTLYYLGLILYTTRQNCTRNPTPKAENQSGAIGYFQLLDLLHPRLPLPKACIVPAFGIESLPGLVHRDFVIIQYGARSISDLYSTFIYYSILLNIVQCKLSVMTALGVTDRDNFRVPPLDRDIFQSPPPRSAYFQKSLQRPVLPEVQRTYVFMCFLSLRMQAGGISYPAYTYAGYDIIVWCCARASL